MKICLVSMEYPPENPWTGIGTYTHDISQAFSKYGNEVHVFAQATEKEQTYIDTDVIVHRIKMSRPKIPIFTDPNGCLLYSRKISKQIQKLKFDVIEAPEWRAQGFAISLFSNTCLITRLHLPLFMLNRISLKKSTPANRLVDFLEKNQTMRSRGVTSSTIALKEVVCNQWKLEPLKVAIIPNGVDINRLRETSTDQNLIGSEYILYLGQMDFRKGAHILARALPLVFERARKLKVVFVGFDTAFNNGTMKEFILKINCKYVDNLIFMGFVSEEKKNTLIRNSKFVVLPSLWEAFGYTCLESMCLGKAVIATKQSGFEEIIEDRKSGFLVEPGDHIGLAKQIIECLETEDKVKLVEKNTSHRIQKFDSKTVAKRLIQYYQASIGL